MTLSDMKILLNNIIVLGEEFQEELNKKTHVDDILEVFLNGSEDDFDNLSKTPAKDRLIEKLESLSSAELYFVASALNEGFNISLLKSTGAFDLNDIDKINMSSEGLPLNTYNAKELLKKLSDKNSIEYLKLSRKYILKA